jgi:hypothetical protein
MVHLPGENPAPRGGRFKGRASFIQARPSE